MFISGKTNEVFDIPRAKLRGMSSDQRLNSSLPGKEHIFRGWFFNRIAPGRGIFFVSFVDAFQCNI